MTRLIPGGRRRRHRSADCLPRLEPSPVQRPRPQHLPPRRDPVPLGRRLRDPRGAANAGSTRAPNPVACFLPRSPSSRRSAALRLRLLGSPGGALRSVYQRSRVQQPKGRPRRGGSVTAVARTSARCAAVSVCGRPARGGSSQPGRPGSWQRRIPREPVGRENPGLERGSGALALGRPPGGSGRVRPSARGRCVPGPGWRWPAVPRRTARGVGLGQPWVHLPGDTPSSRRISLAG
jgi:hypothetical protein